MSPASKNPIEEPKPLAELTEEARKHIDAMGAEIEEAEKFIKAMEELGMDTSRISDHVEWAKRARNIILKTLT
jgi:hypothetical protein